MKLARHEKIIELIKEYDIDTQEELAARLNEAGFKVTQATVSRDIRALKMTKVAGKDGKSRYAILQDTQPGLGDQYTRVLNDAVVSIEVGQNLVVIKTVTGMAMGVATALDALKWPEILGCIAGDDTIACINRSTDDTIILMDKIKKIIKKIRLKRTTVLVIVFIFLSSVLVRQLFSLQIIQGEDYISKFQTRTTKGKF